MAPTFRKLHRHFVGESSSIELRNTFDPDTLAVIRAGMDEYAILVFRDQVFSDAEQLAFGERLDGRLHQGTGSRAFTKSRLGSEAISDISNLDPEGEIMKADDRRRHYTLGNRLWHTDASFVDPPGRYSMLHARVVPPVPADTEYADMRAAYDTLPAEMQAQLEGLHAHPSVAYSRPLLGWESTPAEGERGRAGVHQLGRPTPRGGRPPLSRAPHPSGVIDWPTRGGRLLPRDLREHATHPEFVYRHSWRVGDLVIWD